MSDGELRQLGEVLAEQAAIKRALIDADQQQAEAATRTKQSSGDNERALLGGLLNGGLDVFDDIEEAGLRPDDFSSESRGLIFKAIETLGAKRKAIDTLTVTNELNRIDKLEAAGGASAIAQLSALLPTSAHCESYARIVVDDARRRSLAKLGRVVTRRSERGTAWREVADYAEAELMNLQRRRSSSDFVDVKQAVNDALAKMPAMGGVDSGRATGFADIDDLIKLRDEELIIVAARPSMGKTALVLNCFSRLTIKEQEPCAFFSLEMPAEALCARQIAAEARVDMHAKAWSGPEINRVAVASADISVAPQFIDDKPGISVGEIRARSRAIHRRYGLACIFIDYLQLITPPDPSASRNQQIADISLALKNLARELKVPVVCLSQLNRSVEQRVNKRPMMADLRDSGAVEQDADIILFLYRDDYYAGTKSTKPGIAEVIVAKHRNGRIGQAELVWKPQHTRFYNLSRIP